jgi:hypothetical protein
MTKQNTFWHILGSIGVAVGAAAAVFVSAPIAAIVVPIAGAVATASAYFASNPISLSSATTSALELATVAKQTQAAITKGKPANQ